jgi:hypothetical protein
VRGGEKLKSNRLYNIFWHMIRRTENPDSKDYRYYGAKGITICGEWRNSFEAFQDWAFANGYSDELTIDRKENNKGYSPENCRWVTKAEQNNHKTNTNIVELHGESYTFGDLSRIYGIPCDARLSHNLKFLPAKKYEVWSGMVVEIGKMLGGWIKSVSKSPAMHGE